MVPRFLLLVGGTGSGAATGVCCWLSESGPRLLLVVGGDGGRTAVGSAGAGADADAGACWSSELSPRLLLVTRSAAAGAAARACCS